jgi:TfoX/Sxy family transcriptional regulator of competence genes
MASQQSTVDFIVDQIRGAGVVHAKKMFGEYGVYCDGKMVALVCDDQLYVKPSAPGRAFAGECAEGSPYPGAKPCLVISGDQWDDAEWLTHLIAISAAALPAPKAATKKSK